MSFVPFVFKFSCGQSRVRNQLVDRFVMAEQTTRLHGKTRVFHICLAGQAVSNDWALIQQLKRRHQVTVVERLRLLSRNSILAKADVLVMDSRENKRFSLKVLAFLKKHFPFLCVVLVNGGLTQKQIAAAFRAGVKDYFSDPYNLKLLRERLLFLARHAKNKGQKPPTDRKPNE